MAGDDKGNKNGGADGDGGGNEDDKNKNGQGNEPTQEELDAAYGKDFLGEDKININGKLFTHEQLEEMEKKSSGSTDDKNKGDKNKGKGSQSQNSQGNEGDQGSGDGTRALMLEAVASAGLSAAAAAVSEAALRDAEEIWLTSSSRDLLCVSELDGRAVGNGRDYPLAEAAFEAFQRLKRERCSGAQADAAP